MVSVVHHIVYSAQFSERFGQQLLYGGVSALTFGKHKSCSWSLNGQSSAEQFTGFPRRLHKNRLVENDAEEYTQRNDITEWVVLLSIHLYFTVDRRQAKGS